MNRTFLIAFAWVWLSAGPGLAQSNERAAARIGIEAYNQGDYDVALEKLQEAAAGVALLEVPERVTIYKYLGYCQIAFGRRDEALAQFKRALLLDAGLALPVGTSPKIVSAFDAAKNALESEEHEPERAWTWGGRALWPHPSPGSW